VNGNLNLVYHDFLLSSPSLSSGATYTFNITVGNNVANFIITQGSTQIWSTQAGTGGSFLLLKPLISWYVIINGSPVYFVENATDYTDYEEVQQTHISGGAPCFDFFFSNQNWVATNGTEYSSNSWSSFTAPLNSSYTVPNGIKIGINGDSVTVDNHTPNNPTLSGAATVARNVQYSYVTNAVTDPDFGDQIRSYLNVTGPGTPYQNTTIWVDSGTLMTWNLMWGSTDNPGTYLLQTWVEDLVGQLSNVASLSVNLVGPVCAMKTNCSGWFYVPAVATSGSLKIEDWYTNNSITGDQAGNSSLYPSISWWPDDVVDGKDIAFIARCFGLSEGQTGWNYLADVVPDRAIDGKDIAAAAGNFGNGGTYNSYTTNLGITVTFGAGQPISPDANGFVAIPQGAANFTVEQNGSPIGTLITFWNTTVT
jgi:hypothetical protein